MAGGSIVQVVSSFTATPIEASLVAEMEEVNSDLRVAFTQYASMSSYMLGALPEGTLGSCVLLRVEDWLRHDVVADGSSAGEFRSKLTQRSEEFISQLGVLARCGRPIWYVPCPSGGWVAKKGRLDRLCTTYSNFIVARVKMDPRISVITWPSFLVSSEIVDLSADRLGQIPFTQTTFDRLGTLIGRRIKHDMAQKSAPKGEAVAGSSKELAEYLKKLDVRVSLVRPKPEDRGQLDKIIRNSATFALTGERRDVSEAEIERYLLSEGCRLIHVYDRTSQHRGAGVVSFIQQSNALHVQVFSLSCAVAGKQVEYAVLAALAGVANDLGLSSIVFESERTARNAPIFEFLGKVADPISSGGHRVLLNEVESRIDSSAASPWAWTVMKEDAFMVGEMP